MPGSSARLNAPAPPNAACDGRVGYPAGARSVKPPQSFNYAAWAIDRTDLGIIARSNINGPNQHDADCATFHRVKDFRNPAFLDLSK